MQLDTRVRERCLHVRVNRWVLHAHLKAIASKVVRWLNECGKWKVGEATGTRSFDTAPVARREDRGAIGEQCVQGWNGGGVLTLVARHQK